MKKECSGKIGSQKGKSYPPSKKKINKKNKINKKDEKGIW